MNCNDWVRVFLSCLELDADVVVCGCAGSEVLGRFGVEGDVGLLFPYWWMGLSKTCKTWLSWA